MCLTCSITQLVSSGFPCTRTPRLRSVCLLISAASLASSSSSMIIMLFSRQKAWINIWWMCTLTLWVLGKMQNITVPGYLKIHRQINLSLYRQTSTTHWLDCTLSLFSPIILSTSKKSKSNLFYIPFEVILGPLFLWVKSTQGNIWSSIIQAVCTSQVSPLPLKENFATHFHQN